MPVYFFFLLLFAARECRLNFITETSLYFTLCYCLIAFYIFTFIYFLKKRLFWAVLGLRCSFSLVGRGGLPFVVLCVFSLRCLLLLQSSGCRARTSVIVAYGLSCSAVCEIFLDQGLNPCSLRWQVDSYSTELPGESFTFLSLTRNKVLNYLILLLYLTIILLLGTYWAFNLES